jgi:hypothetical protein
VDIRFDELWVMAAVYQNDRENEIAFCGYSAPDQTIGNAKRASS